MAWRSIGVMAGCWVVASAFAVACSSSEEGPTGADAGFQSSGAVREPGGGAKPGNTFGDDGTSGGKRPPSSSSGGSDAGSTSSTSGEPNCDDPDDTSDPNFDLVPFAVNGPTVFVDGILNGADDVDEYSYDVTGTYPAPNLFFVDPGPVATICFYMTCLSDPIDADGGTVTPVVTCASGMTAATDKYGQPGCCSADGSATSQTRVQGGYYCDGAADDHSWLYIDVTSQQAQCAPYRLRVAF
jgi:hypothetical protein